MLMSKKYMKFQNLSVRRCYIAAFFKLVFKVLQYFFPTRSENIDFHVVNRNSRGFTLLNVDLKVATFLALDALRRQPPECI